MAETVDSAKQIDDGIIWHTLDINEVLEKTGSSIEGLHSETVKTYIEKFGPNELIAKKKKSPLVLFLSQFKDFMIIVLMIAAIISGVVGDLTDTIIILIIVLLNAVIGFIQEYRAEKAMEALQKLATPNATVLRNNETVKISSVDLVPGDIVLLEAGNLIPADMRILEVHSMRIEESSLTGESVPVDKNNERIEKTDIPLGDRFNMAFKGTIVINGRGKGVVTATGMQTELGHIASMLQEKEVLTPLQIQMNEFGRKISYIILVICAVLLGVGLLRGEDPVTMLLTSISLAVAAIPEALPALITIALARGANKLVKQNALIRKLPAVETLGSVTFICTDKTGTLTQNKMKVVEVSPAEVPLDIDSNPMLFSAMALNHDVRKGENSTWIGDPTEIAMIEYLETTYGNSYVKNLLKNVPREAEIPFDSDRKCMTTIHKIDGKFIVISKGAIEVISNILKDHSIRDTINHLGDELASQGIRVLAYGYKELDRLPASFTFEEVENDLVYAGLVGMIDPPREEVKEAIKECKTAGISPVMITGDHRETASAIARDIGILGKDELAITGTELGALSPDELDEKVERIKVYARVSPEQKLNIVKSLQRKNHFIAMTGDGVNDAPSLKRANIGIAMGITGTDVSKEASDMILLDDNFATIVKAVKEGRTIYDNIKKFIKYIMTCNGAEILTIFFAPIFGLPIPLLPIHILWINLVTDGLPGLALSYEKPDRDIMELPPRKSNESLLTKGIYIHIIWVGILMASVTIGLQVYAIDAGKENWQTMVFTVLSLSQLGHVFAIRSDREYIFRKGFFTNMPLIGAILLTFLLQMAVIYLPFANEVLKTKPLSFNELLLCVAISCIVFTAVEFEKVVKARYRKKHYTAAAA